MSKNKSVFNCSNCNYITYKWLGCCPECNEWNSISETIQKSQPFAISGAVITMAKLSDIITKPKNRITSGIKEWDRVVGGGLMPGCFVIVTGDPGIGKSTLLLAVAHEISKNYKVFYFSSEESLEQVKLRAQRTDCLGHDLYFSDQANLDDVLSSITVNKPDLVIIDSIQNCHTPGANMIPGSVGQLKEAAFKLMRIAKDHNISIIVTGHITKDGNVAGPKMLEHIVDAVFYLQGEDRWQTRVLRSVKNRFGAVFEIGFFQMDQDGMKEFANINQQLIEEISFNPGSVLTSYIEGSRPLLIELQALTIATKFTMPQRLISGIDQTQVVLIAAILEKYLQIKLSSSDIFFKVSGGLKIKSSGSDLAIALAILSSYFQKPLPEKSLAIGEISLTGQIKPINHINIHINEAFKFGINKLLVANHQKVEHPNCKTVKFQNVYDLLSLFA